MPEEGALKVYTSQEAQERLAKELPEWSYQDGYLTREIYTRDWKETVLIFGAIAYISEVHRHHPNMEVSFKNLKVKLITHEFGSITERDFDLAKDIEKTLFMRQKK
ncbi:MAG: 4a-hydroxytetrahydrobiopterin dehydratase [Aquificaceae bacterium]